MSDYPATRVAKSQTPPFWLREDPLEEEQHLERIQKHTEVHTADLTPRVPGNPRSRSWHHD